MCIRDSGDTASESIAVRDRALWHCTSGTGANDNDAKVFGTIDFGPKDPEPYATRPYGPERYEPESDASKPDASKPDASKSYGTE